MSELVQKDTTFTKIFVGGLPYHTTDKSLRQFFEVFGEIEEAVVITDRQTGKSRGYGFVTMADKDAAERAVKDPNPIIDGRKANVNLAYLGAKPRANVQQLNGECVMTDLFTGFPLCPTTAALRAAAYPALLQAAASQYTSVNPYLYQPYLAAAAAAAASTPSAATLTAAAQAAALLHNPQQMASATQAGTNQAAPPNANATSSAANSAYYDYQQLQEGYLPYYYLPYAAAAAAAATQDRI